MDRDAIVADVGQDVAQLVEALTDDQTLPAEERRSQQLDRAAGLPLVAKQIKLADRLVNVREARPDWSLEKRKCYAVHSYALLAVLRGSHAALEARLRERLSQPQWTL